MLVQRIFAKSCHSEPSYSIQVHSNGYFTRDHNFAVKISIAFSEYVRQTQCFLSMTGKPATVKSLAEQVADLDDPAPRGKIPSVRIYKRFFLTKAVDVDPEALEDPVNAGDESNSSSQDEELGDAREHYIDVGCVNASARNFGSTF